MPRQATCLVIVLLVRHFSSAYSLCGLPRLLRPLLTSCSGSPPSPFQAQGKISPGKNAILHRTTAAFTSPGRWPQELRSYMPARPGRRRLSSGSCTSAHGLRSTLPPHARSPSRSCASLASLWPARPGTCTPTGDLHPKESAHAGRTRKRPPKGPFRTCWSRSCDQSALRRRAMKPTTPKPASMSA
jgi:hypothetical protein